MKVGILGSGQLAKMLALTAHPMAIQTHCFDEHEGCAAAVTKITCGDLQDAHALRQWASTCDVITFENENISLTTIDHIADCCPIYPSRLALAISQDRLLEKNHFRAQEIQTAEYIAIDSQDTLTEAVKQLGLPAVLKTRRLGYDGKGQFVLRQTSDIRLAFEKLNNNDLILEKWLTFDKEVSQIAVRDNHGHMQFYPLTENVHTQGILRVSRTLTTTSALEKMAEAYTRRIAESLNYVGVLAIEFFVVDQQLIANEMAPRVHNSGHWTIEGAYTSQFSQHLRAITQLTLGETLSHSPAGMLNYIGCEPKIANILAIPGTHHHWYGKKVKPDRKVGHVTVLAPTEEILQYRIDALQKLL